MNVKRKERVDRSDTDAAIGQPVPRVDGPAKVSGAAAFTADVSLPDLAYASLVLSTIAKGHITELDVRAAEQAPGVIAVMTYQNAPRMKTPTDMFADQKSAAVSNLPVMQDPAIAWNGQPVAVVIAETQEQSDAAASDVRISYARERASVSFAEARSTAYFPDKVLGEPAKICCGDAEAALRNAAVRLDHTYCTPRYNHNAIELHAVTARWLDEDAVEIYDAAQYLAGTRHSIAASFGLDPDKVHVISRFVGGGFGGKTVWNHHFLCVAAARLTGRPVRLVLNREEQFRVIGGRTLSEQRVALGATRDGRLQALIHTGTTAVVSHNHFPEQFSFPARHLYATDSYLIAQQVVELDTVANTSMRAPGESIGTFALECAIDELAVACQLDPIELRRRLEPDQDPTTGTAFSARHMVEAYRRGAERFGWAQRNLHPGAQRAGEWLIGQGVATALYPYYRMQGGSARLQLSADGALLVQAAAHEMGMGTATVQAQHAAERLGLPLAAVTFQYGDSRFPDSPVAGGSSQTVSIAAAVAAASDALIDKLLQLAAADSPLHGARRQDLQIRDGGIYRSSDGQGATFVALLRRAGLQEIAAQAAASKPEEMQQHSMHSFGAQFCEVRVSDVTGEVRVSRWLGSFDTGRILNPRTAASQFRGGIVMGIGMALTEETFFDARTGRHVNASLSEYHVPVHLDIPPIEVIWNDIPDPQAPLGARGIGEIGITGAAAAIANAIYNATGKRIRDLPITLDKVLVAPRS